MQQNGNNVMQRFGLEDILEICHVQASEQTIPEGCMGLTFITGYDQLGIFLNICNYRRTKIDR